MNSQYKITKIQVIEYFQLNAAVSDDSLLRKIHFKRSKQSLPTFCMQYLYEVFLGTNDLRFFNELLWLSIDNEIAKSAIQHFKTQLNENGSYRYCYDEDLKSCLSLKGESIKVDKKDFNNTVIGLIGSPFHFVGAHRKLKKMGVSADVINVKYEPNKIKNIILNNGLVSLCYQLFFGKKNYYEIVVTDKKELKHLKLPKHYDIGFHKLGFIISKGLIDQFQKGLINDHWGALPLFKGRSTLEYSKLFGAKLVVTNHLVKPEIDAGDILSFTPLNSKKIKRAIYLGLTNRIVQSLGLLALNQKMNIDNSKGKMFYEMQPWLINYVKGLHI